jgi:hypothetical protein
MTNTKINHEAIQLKGHVISKICRDIHKSRCTTGINDTSGKFFHHFVSVVNTGGKFATRVHDTGGGILPLVSTTGGKFTTSVKDTKKLSNCWQLKTTI